MLARFTLAALSLSVFQTVTGSPLMFPQIAGSYGFLDAPAAFFGRRILARPAYVIFARTTHRTIMKRGCHSAIYSKRSLLSRHKHGYASPKNEGDDEDDEDDDRYAHEDEEKDEDSYGECKDDDNYSSSPKPALPGLGGLGKGGGGTDSTPSDAGGPTKMLGGAGVGGGGMASMLSGAGSPTKTLGGGGGKLPLNPTKSASGGGAGGLPGLGKRSRLPKNL